MGRISSMNVQQLQAAIYEAHACSTPELAQAQLTLLMPELLARGNALLAVAGMALPALLGQATNAAAFAHLMTMDPRMAATQSSGKAHDSYWSPAEEATNVRETYGRSAAKIYGHAENSLSLAELALLLALTGAGTDDLVNVLGPNNPSSLKLARALNKLAKALTTLPLDVGAIRDAFQGAQWAIVEHVASGTGNRAGTERFMRDFYGIERGGTYRARGSLGNTVESHCPCSPSSGEFVTSDPSQSGLAALRACQSQVGVREASGCNDGVPSQRYSNGRCEPWCANFVTWAFQQSGHPLPGNQRSNASVAYMESQMKRTGKFHNGTPQPGDIIFFSNRGQSDRGSGRHVGIVEKVENGRVYTIEGNSSNSVRRRSYPLGAGRISGYGRP